LTINKKSIYKRQLLIYYLLTFAVLQYILNAGGENVAEKTITIRIDDALHKDIKINIAKRGISLKDYIVQLIKKDLYGEIGKK